MSKCGSADNERGECVMHGKECKPLEIDEAKTYFELSRRLSEKNDNLQSEIAGLKEAVREVMGFIECHAHADEKNLEYCKREGICHWLSRHAPGEK